MLSLGPPAEHRLAAGSPFTPAEGDCLKSLSAVEAACNGCVVTCRLRDTGLFLFSVP